MPYLVLVHGENPLKGVWEQALESLNHQVMGVEKWRLL